MSLQEFTWQEFLLGALILSLLWGLGVWLIYWRPLSPKTTHSGIGRGTHESTGALQHRWQDQVDDLNSKGEDLMGKPALEQGVSVVEADDFSFVETGGERADQTEMLGYLADVQQEIKTACHILASEDGTKEDFFSLFEVIRAKYPKLASSPMLDKLNGFIREQMPFYLSEEELQRLWV